MTEKDLESEVARLQARVRELELQQGLVLREFATDPADPRYGLPVTAVCPACVLGNPLEVRVRLCAAHAAMPGAALDLTNHHSALACPYCNPHRLQLADTAVQREADRLLFDLAWAVERKEPDADGMRAVRVGGTKAEELRVWMKSVRL